MHDFTNLSSSAVNELALLFISAASSAISSSFISRTASMILSMSVSSIVMPKRLSTFFLSYSRLTNPSATPPAIAIFLPLIAFRHLIAPTVVRNLFTKRASSAFPYSHFTAGISRPEFATLVKRLSPVIELKSSTPSFFGSGTAQQQTGTPSFVNSFMHSPNHVKPLTVTTIKSQSLSPFATLLASSGSKNADSPFITSQSFF